MRKRLLLVLAVIGALALTGFAIPLALSTAEARTRQFVLQRESDAQRFAGLASDYVRTGDAKRLWPEVNAYYATYGDPILVVSTRGVPNLSAGMTVDARVDAAIRRGLRNERGSEITRLTPFRTNTELFVRPVGTGAQVNGAVVIEASTAGARQDIARAWAGVAAGWTVALVSFGVLAVGLSRWILRPLSDLSGGMEQLAARLPAVPADNERAVNADDSQIAIRSAGPPEMRRLSQTFQRLVATVLRSVEAQRRLVADASHQLRNPLTALQFRLDLLEDEVPASAAGDYRLAADEARRLHDILDGLLTLAAAETPTLADPTAKEGCNVVSVVTERVEFWTVVAADRGAHITFANELGDDAMRVCASESNLSQILDVLIDNATRHAGEHPTIVVSTRMVPADGVERIEVAVDDDGPGIPEEELTKVTQRFYTTGSGSGLGLSIVDVIVLASGGQLTLGSSSLGGLSVRVRLDRLAERGQA